MGVIDDTGFSNIIKYLRLAVEARRARAGRASGLIEPRIMLVFSRVPVISFLPIGIFLLLSGASSTGPVGE